MYLTTPPPVAAKLPQVVQELIGSSICLGNFYGCFDQWLFFFEKSNKTFNGRI